jgi:hypothetical protein
VTLREGVVGALGAAGLADHLQPKASAEHPLVETLPGVAERGVEGLTIAGTEPIQRDREVVNAYL